MDVKEAGKLGGTKIRDSKEYGVAHLKRISKLGVEARKKKRCPKRKIGIVCYRISLLTDRTLGYILNYGKRIYLGHRDNKLIHRLHELQTGPNEKKERSKA